MTNRKTVLVTGASHGIGAPMGTTIGPEDIAEAVVYLVEASHVTGEVLHVDDGAHAGRW